jgi:hypothetical protein
LSCQGRTRLPQVRSRLSTEPKGAYAREPPIPVVTCRADQRDMGPMRGALGFEAAGRRALHSATLAPLLQRPSDNATTPKRALRLHALLLAIVPSGPANLGSEPVALQGLEPPASCCLRLVHPVKIRTEHSNRVQGTSLSLSYSISQQEILAWQRELLVEQFLSH